MIRTLVKTEMQGSDKQIIAEAKINIEQMPPPYNGNRSVVGNRGGWWTLSNRGDIGLSLASRETAQTNKPLKHYTKTGGQNISSSLKKKRKHTQWVRAPIRVQV